MRGLNFKVIFTQLESRYYIIRKAQVSYFLQVLILFQPVSLLEVDSIEYSVFKPKQPLKTGWYRMDLYCTSLATLEPRFTGLQENSG